MSIKAIIAAAAMAVGVGQAEAATYTTETYEMTVRYEGTSFSDVAYSAIYGEEITQHYSHVEAGNTTLGLKSHLLDLPAIGTLLQFSLKIMHPDVPFHVPYYGNGGYTPVCQLGSWNCTATDQTYLGSDSFWVSYDDDWRIDGVPQAGTLLSVYFSPIYGGGNGTHASVDGNYIYSYQFENSYFTILSVNEPAPVPLPATAALLPLGLGALALMRRRRRLA